MDQTLNRVAESLALLLDQRDAGEGEGVSKQRPRSGRTFTVLPSHDSLPSYDQLSSSPPSFSSNPTSTTACPKPPLSTTTSVSQDESRWSQTASKFFETYLSVYLKISILSPAEKQIWTQMHNSETDSLKKSHHIPIVNIQVKVKNQTGR